MHVVPMHKYTDSSTSLDKQDQAYHRLGLLGKQAPNINTGTGTIL
jgi:hypothetical protein